MKNIITITEPISRSWNNESVWLDAEPGYMAVDASTGQALPAQLCGTNPNNFRDKQQLCVNVNLSPDQVVNIELCPGEPADIDNNFAVKDLTCCYEISNGVLSVIIPQSQSFDPGWAPGPVLAMKYGDNRWCGKGTFGCYEFAGRLETVVIDAGPLFARWITRYLLDGMVLASYDCRLWAGEDFIHFSENSRLRAGMEFRFELSGDDLPMEWFSYGGGEQSTVVRGTLDNQPSPKGCKRENEVIHIDFNSGHFQMSYTWAGFLLDNDLAIGITELNGGMWEYPGLGRIRAMQHDDGGVYWLLTANGGTRQYALACGSSTDYAPESGMTKFCAIHRKISDLPLEKVRHWQTRWMPAPRTAPLLYPVGTADCWREKLDAWPELDAAYKGMAQQMLDGKHVLSGGMLPAYLASGCNTKILEILIKRIESDLDSGVSHAVDNGYLRLIIFDGRMIKVDLETMDFLLWRGEIDTDRAQKIIQKMLFLSYCFADENFWPYQSLFREAGDPLGIGQDYIDDIGQSIDPPNFTTEYFTSFGMVGLTFPGHPAAEEWITKSEVQFERQLNFHFYESGGYIESLNYHNHTLGMIEQLAIALRASGRANFFNHPIYKANYGFFQKMLTPPVVWQPVHDEPASGAGVLHPMPAGQPSSLIHIWGNSGHDCCGYAIPSFLAVGAGVYADSDPDYARSLMTAWRSGPAYFCTHYFGLNLLAMGRPDLPDAALNPASEVLEGLGATFRADYGTGKEIFAWVKCGTATHHNCRDEGGIVLYAHGAQLLGDFGYHHTTSDGKTAGGYNTWKHTCVTFDGNSTSAYTGVEKATPPELWRSTPAADLLACRLPVEYIIPDANAYLDTVHIPRIDHRRWILFIKPDYFVIYDHIPASTVDATWWLHAMTDNIETAPGMALIKGRTGVNLDVRMLTPENATLQTGEYGGMQHLKLTIPAGVGTFASILTPLAKGMTPPSSAKISNNEIQITGSWGEDRIILGKILNIPAPMPVKILRNGVEIFKV